MELLDIYLPLFTCTTHALQADGEIIIPPPSHQQQSDAVMPSVNDDEQHNLSPATVLRQTLLQLNDIASQTARKKNYCQQDTTLATFATFVCLDEMILCTENASTEMWGASLLQNELPGRGLGGVMFFDHLATLDDENHQVRLIFLFCLFIGYKGRYIQEGNDSLNRIIEHEINKLPLSYQNCLVSNKNSHWNSFSPTVKKTRGKSKSIGGMILLSVIVIYVVMNIILVY